MNNLNSILIEGNLVKDPLLRATPKGTQFCSMSLASNRYHKQDSGFEKEVYFFNVECWSRLAETCYSQGKKGRGVRVVGRLKQDRWTGSDGKPQSRITIVAEHIEFRPEFKKEASQVTEMHKKAAAYAAAENPPVPYTEQSYNEEYNAMLANQPSPVF